MLLDSETAWQVSGVPVSGVAVTAARPPDPITTAIVHSRSRKEGAQLQDELPTAVALADLCQRNSEGARRFTTRDRAMRRSDRTERRIV